MKFRFAHESIEINAGLLIGLTMLVISIGGLVEIVPLFYIDETIEKVAPGGTRMPWNCPAAVTMVWIRPSSDP